MFIEERIRTEVTERYDVIVCGGGFAGISAALAAARPSEPMKRPTIAISARL